MTERPAPRFHRTDRRVVASNSRFDVLFDRLEGPEGAVVPDFLIVRPKVQLAQQVTGVCVLPEVDGRIGLMRSYRDQFGEEIWQAPAGFAEPGDTAESAALRELREEAGLACPPERLQPLGLTIPDAGVLEARVALFVARDARPEDGAPGDVEPGTGSFVYFDPPALADLVRTSPSMGAATMVACFRYLAARQSGR